MKRAEIGLVRRDGKIMLHGVLKSGDSILPIQQPLNLTALGNLLTPDEIAFLQHCVTGAMDKITANQI